ncbi:hypothetical protein LguiA_010288 [Lonicera macranthoides]
MSKFFGGKDPFDDPFFTRPFGGIFSGKNPFDDPFFTNPFDYQSGSKKEISIEELGSKDDTQKHSEPSKELVVKNPNNETNGTQNFSFQRVAYGGINGMYYTSSIGRRTGGDGTVLMEIKEEDKTMGQALSTISKGIHDKGHSVTTKHNPDGTVDSIQTLHNLYEDELAGFEETWKVNADKRLPGWSNGFNLLEDTGSISRGWDELAKWGGWALPYTEQWGDAGATVTDSETGAVSSSERPKKVVPVNIE